jgi:hypothetical protein
MEKTNVNALKHATKDRLAVVTTPTVYFSNLEGVIERHFPNSRFNTTYYTEIVPFPADFEIAKKNYFDALREKRKEEEAKHKVIDEALYQKRRDEVLNLRKWRRGELECYAVTSYKWVTADLNWDKEDLDYKLFFSLDDANKAFDEVYKENEDFDELGYRFYVELTKIQSSDHKGGIIDVPLAERLKITSVEDIYKTYAQHSNMGGIRMESIEQELPEDAIVVTEDYKGNLIYIRRPELGEQTGDLPADKDSMFSDKTTVYWLSELNVIENEELLEFIIAKLELTRDDLKEYLSEYELNLMFEDKE